tara:strand:- start:2046 stop:2288 length:243 start_codon:yes stop_codon:yes gene_type:complete
MKKYKQQTPDNKNVLEGLSTYSLCRWAALKEAVDVIGDKCDERKIDFNTFNDIKPLNILNYVDSVTDVLYDRATKEYEKV